MRAPWELDQPWFTITYILAGMIAGLAIIIPIEIFT